MDEAATMPTDRAMASLDLDWATTLNNIANTYMYLQEYTNAIEYYSAGKRIIMDRVSPYHPDVATAYFNIGSAHKHLEDYDTALEMYDAAGKIRERLFGVDHVTTTSCHIALADVLLTLGHTERAREFYQSALLARQMQSGAGAACCAPCYTGVASLCLCCYVEDVLQLQQPRLEGRGVTSEQLQRIFQGHRFHCKPCAYNRALQVKKRKWSGAAPCL